MRIAPIFVFGSRNLSCSLLTDSPSCVCLRAMSVLRRDDAATVDVPFVGESFDVASGLWKVCEQHQSVVLIHSVFAGTIIALQGEQHIAVRACPDCQFLYCRIHFHSPFYFSRDPHHRNFFGFSFFRFGDFFGLLTVAPLISLCCSVKRRIIFMPVLTLRITRVLVSRFPFGIFLAVPRLAFPSSIFRSVDSQPETPDIWLMRLLSWSSHRAKRPRVA